MNMNTKLLGYVFTLLGSITSVSCEAQESINQPIKTGADQIESYIKALQDKRVGLLVNHTSYIEDVHLLDTLTSMGIRIETIFAPEHGFRGNHANGEKVNNEIDEKTQTPVISLYGKNKKPTIEQLSNIDVVIYDVQDVGARFYTYISTMSHMMEACAENGISMLVLDRPNPNGHYVDGPILKKEFSSFVGLHEVPVVHGMTVGEYAKMVNGEGWLKNGVQCDLTVIPLENYTHNSEYSLTIRPSPNLPNDKSINLYPSLGFFEGTIINAGRGTEFQFQRYGASFFSKSDFSYTPKANFGAKYPKQKGKLCFGVDLRNTKKLSAINLEWLIDAYQKTPKTEKFFGKTFTIHAGNTKLQQQIEQGLTAKEIRKTWQKDITKFKKIRKQYLIYN